MACLLSPTDDKDLSTTGQPKDTACEINVTIAVYYISCKRTQDLRDLIAVSCIELR
jgi:hypothetical protein